jgi:hypothetical protein
MMEPRCTTIDERDLTDEERAAIADEPRPGRWALSSRELSQHGTDVAIVAELWRDWRNGPIYEIVAPWLTHSDETTVSGGYHAQQRGGNHSDPLVRLLAFRAWGNRDRHASRVTVTGRRERDLADDVKGSAIHRLPETIAKVADRHGVSPRDVLAAVRRINTNQDAVAVLDAYERRLDDEDRRRAAIERDLMHYTPRPTPARRRGSR